MSVINAKRAEKKEENELKEKEEET